MKQLLLVVCALFLVVGCADNTHFITDKTYREQTENDLARKKQALPDGDLFKVFDLPISLKEKEALSFIYAYAPIGDITDYSGDFHLENVHAAFRARQEMPWGETIPEDVFRHFVLPVRVNNESLDNSRMVFYDELKDRVKNLPLADAVLEINHWCHEKVTYTPSDARTSSPLASVLTAYGRCGEESVFTVAALRALSIPARQVYTPRWAHTDDNHAWVEAWIDGQWYFFGACEPEPILNLAWFNEPASRGILMHTEVYGKYNGVEEIIETNACTTEINVTSIYAPTAPIIIRARDINGKPVEDALVEFKIYNYAEFYSAVTRKTNSEGIATLTAGKGDMLAWVSKDNLFGFQKISFGTDKDVTIVLDKKAGDAISLDLDIVPPVSTPITIQVTEEQKAENDRRMNKEDSIRNSYVGTFYTKEKAAALAEKLKIDAEKATEYLINSRGNWKEIESFLLQTPSEDLGRAMDLLGAIFAKDLRDTPADVLQNHIQHTKVIDSKYFTEYVLNPRVRNELITPYRSFFIEQINIAEAQAFAADPQLLVKWVSEHIRVEDDLNPLRIPIRPMGVWNARVADKLSRDVFFVALARSLSIPSRIDPVTSKVQYIQQDNWVNVDFEKPEPITTSYGKIDLVFPKDFIGVPEYDIHYTIARVHSNGKLQTLGFRSDENIKELEEGDYLLISGVRMANGNVLTSAHSFRIDTGKTTRINLTFRDKNEEVKVIGSIDAEATFILVNESTERSILSTTGRGYFIIGILGSCQEPTNHVLRDIATFADRFNQWNRSMILLFKDQQTYEKYDAHEFGTLPETITYGIDVDGKITKMIGKAMFLPHTNTQPIFIIADSFGRVVFISQGYTIGLGGQLLNVIDRI